MIAIAVVSDAILAASLVAEWANCRDRADVRPGRGAQASLLARAALRALLARHTGRADWRMLRTMLGKPFVVDPSGGPGPAVSLSHTGSIVAVALAETGTLGVDVEQYRRRDFGALAGFAFGPAERAAVAVSGGDAFYRIWTLREALAKATGEGLALAANRCDLVGDGASGRIAHGGRAWQLAHFRIDPDCHLAVAHAGAADGKQALCWSDLR